MSWKEEFGRFREAHPTLLHFAAHSHHYWPDVTFEAQQQAWLDACARVDEKWGPVFDELLPRAREHVARVLSLSDPGTVALAGNTHELLLRIWSCFERRPTRVLTSGSEFHSFTRQSRRWQEAGEAVVERIPTQPFDSFESRLLEAAAAERYDLVYLSQVFFDSGFVFDAFDALVERLSEETWLVVDGYHGFMARPTSWAALEERAFYLSGGYKYVMAGEGCCFMHCPPGYGERPVDTGWYAVFGDLQQRQDEGAVPYARDAMRFMGSTFDPTAWYRFVAAMDLWQELGVTVKAIHDHVRQLHGRFLEAVADGEAGPLDIEQLVPPVGVEKRGNFLTFERPDAAELHAELRRQDVLTDVRGERIRFGFGVYHDAGDVDALIARLSEL